MCLVGAAVGCRAGELVNPVARCADCGVFAHRGHYYITGTGLPRQALVSSDLVHWRGPHGIFSEPISWADSRSNAGAIHDVHASCVAYLNGRFHLYWNGIGHAVAEQPLGPYTQPDPTTRFDGEIDPFLLADEDGALYFYTVKFDGGNQIWGQPMAAPHQLEGTPVRLLDASPGTWERRCWNIVEGPEVMRYRDRCYLLYAANHTSVGYGHYAIGCAVSETPLGFDEESKYPFPVLCRNEFSMDLAGDVLLRTGARGGPPWQYSMDEPPTGWMAPESGVPESEAPAEWLSGRGGFGWPRRPQDSQVHAVNTPWRTEQIWLRHEFELDRVPSGNLRLRIRHWHAAEVYFNGVPAYRNARWGGPRLVPVAPEAIAALRPGRNVIAAHVRSPVEGERYIDIGLFDPGQRVPDDVVWNPGQPNVVRGPNGFEWFLSYFAMWNEGPHCQGINRIRFFDRDLRVDGPTGSRPLQYHPDPYPATFADRFDTHRMDRLGERRGQGWRYAGGRWHVEDGEARVSRGGNVSEPPAGTARAFPRVPVATHYLFEAAVRSLPGNENPYGLTVWHADDRNWLRVTLDPSRQAWRWRRSAGGDVESASHALPPTFDFGAYHTLRVENNSGRVDLWIDHVKVTATAGPLATGSAREGQVALLSEGALAAYDAVRYTIGWDEHAGNMVGWHGGAAAGAPHASASAAVTPGPRGLVLASDAGDAVLVKGDLAVACEFMVDVSHDGPATLPDAGFGVYAVHAGPENWVRADLDPLEHVLRVNGRLAGEAVPSQEVSLGGRRRLHIRTHGPSRPSGIAVSASHCFEKDDVAAACDGRIPRLSQARLPKHTFWPHRGTEEWIQYDFDTPLTVDGAEVIWYDDRRSNGGCRVPAAWYVAYRKDETWVPVTLEEDAVCGTDMDRLHAARFLPVTTSALRLVVQQQEGFGSGVYEWTLLQDGKPMGVERVQLALQDRAIVTGMTLRFDVLGGHAPPADIVLVPDGVAAPIATTAVPSNAGDGWVSLRFPPVETGRVALQMRRTPGRHLRLLEAEAVVEGRTRYNVRTVKRRDEILIFVDGEQCVTVPGAWPAARVGLFVRGMSATFGATTCFAIPVD